MQPVANFVALQSRTRNSAMDPTAMQARGEHAKPGHADREHAPHRHREHLHHRALSLARRTPSADRTVSATQAPATSATLNALSYQRSERSTLFITTQEGDTVEIEIRARESGSLEASTQNDGEVQSSEVRTEMRSALKVQFSVKGDLNADELAAINDVIEQASAIADDFFAGNLGTAFSLAEELGIDATQLAKVGLRMNMREQLTYSQIGSSRAFALPSPQPAPAPHASPAVVASAAPTGADAARLTTPTSAAAVVGAPAAAGDDSPATTSDALASGQPASLNATLLDGIGSFLRQLMDRLDAPASDGGTQTSIDLSIKLKVFQAIVTTATSSQTSPDAADLTVPALLAQTLDAIAAPHEPPLRAVA